MNATKQIPQLTDKQRAYFFARLRRDETTGCLEWQGYRSRTGYGKVSINDRMYLAHRIAFSVFHGESTSDKPLVCHSCDNPCCCEKSHLWAGTIRDNVIDCLGKGRGNIERAQEAQRLNPKYATGDSHWTRLYPDKVLARRRNRNSKLTEDKVAEIRKKHSNGISRKDLAIEYGVSRRNIGDVVVRAIWRHVL